jgi:protein-S-isoprenylcysteine O-methyltransferase Ste14
MTNIDEMLARLPAVADDGFSARVMHRIAREKLRRQGAMAAVVAACLLPALFVFPWHDIGLTLGTLLPYIAGNAGIQLATAVVALTVLGERAFSRP